MSILIAFAVPGFIALLVVESLITARSNVRGYETKDTFASLAMGVGNVVSAMGFLLVADGRPRMSRLRNQ